MSACLSLTLTGVGYSWETTTDKTQVRKNIRFTCIYTYSHITFAIERVT